MKKTVKKTAALLALSLLPAAAHAQFFVEGTFGAAKVDLGEFQAQGFFIDEAAGTWSIGAGYMFNPYLGIEAGYRSFEEFELTSPGAFAGTFGGRPFSAAGSVNLKADAQGVYVGPVFETFIERFRLNARAGGFAWKSDVTVGGATHKDDGFDGYLGLGVSYAMTPKAFFGLSLTRFRVLDEIDVDAWDIRLKYSF
jgi:hypothetical protein